MNEVMEKQFKLLKIYQPMRTEILAALKDKDLTFQPKNSPSVVEICLQIGEWQQSYIDGFKHFKQDFDYRNSDTELRKTVDATKRLVCQFGL